MNNALAIAAVTAVLKDILENALANDAIATSVGDTLVTALPPDRISVGNDERPQLNLFLYQVSQNRNADWLGRDRLELKSDHPPLALDLHYLLTAYGAKDFQAELLLGFALQLLHSIPVISRDRLQTAMQKAASTSTFGALSQALTMTSVSDLVNQLGGIKLSPEFFNMEETSKLWSSMQTHYRPSAAYQASMVLIQGQLSNPSSESPECVFPQPWIDAIEPNEAITAGAILTLKGKQLKGELTFVRIVNRSSLLKPRDVTPDHIRFVLPQDLPAGVQGVQVIHQTPQPVESNVAAFVVQPIVTVRVENVQKIDNLWSADLVIRVKPRILPEQQAILLLGFREDVASILQTIKLEVSNPEIDILRVPLKVLQSGRYWVQLQVDGATSFVPGADSTRFLSIDL
ncbi:DUF4255 domain-containing protein [Cyanobacteria bacterium FACHB-63]|nr:DUF4255 domain-containing protein [Cyanobacteria bacterium FACHB-63]